MLRTLLHARGFRLCLAIAIAISSAPASTAAQEADPADAWRTRLLEIAETYTQWERVDDEAPRWAPANCRLPSRGTGRFSEAEALTAHGRKLYYLYALHAAAYRETRPDMGLPGQVLVKEAWQPEEVERDRPPHDFEVDERSDRPFAHRGGKVYRAGAPAGLFVMFREPADVPGTDDGWVYGTLDQGGRVTAAGRLQSCVDCHRFAPHGRLFGVELEPTPMLEFYPPPAGTAERWEDIQNRIAKRFAEVPQLSLEHYRRRAADSPPPELIDVRAREEFEVAWIPGARHVAHGPDFVDAFDGVPRDREIVLYCSVGWRSSAAAQELRAAGFTDVSNLDGSIFAWANAGRPLRNAQGYTYRVHGYDAEWSQLLRPERRAPLP